MALPFGWLTCLSPVGADLLAGRPVSLAQVAQVQVVPVQVVLVQVVLVQVVPVQRPLVHRPQPLLPKARAKQGHAQQLRQASPVRPQPITWPWLAPTHA
jgi:hypothetical protein